MDSREFAIQPGRWQCVASLRYFAGARNFAADMAVILGGSLPGSQQTVCYGSSGSDAQRVLCWRSPTETLIVCNAALLGAMESFAASRSDMCVVDQTGGIRAWTLTGPRVADVLVRLGSVSMIPAPGEARIGLLAELSVLACCVRTGETVLLVDRAYEQHLKDWVRETVVDLGFTPADRR